MKTEILNLTKNITTPEQCSDGVVEPGDKLAIQKLLTFNTLNAEREPEHQTILGLCLAAIALIVALYLIGI